MVNLIDASAIGYTPKIFRDWFVASFKKANLFNENYLRIFPNVTKDLKLNKLSQADTVTKQDNRDCSWNPQAVATATDKLVSVRNWEVQTEKCLKELDNLWSEMALSGGANTLDFPDRLEAALMQILRDLMAADVDRIILGGDGNAVDGVQEGIIDQLLVDPDMPAENKITAVTIDSSNVRGEIAKVYQAIPKSVLGLGRYNPERYRVNIFVDMYTFDYLLIALSEVANAQNVILPNFRIAADGDSYRIWYMNIEIVALNYMPLNTILAFSRENVGVLTDVMAETSTLRVAKGADLKTENIWYAKGEYRLYATYIFSDEIVLYSPNV